MPRGIHTALDTNSRISTREQCQCGLHNGCLRGTKDTERSAALAHPNLDGDGPRWLRERRYIACHAQWHEDSIVVQAAGCGLVEVTAGRVAATVAHSVFYLLTTAGGDVSESIFPFRDEQETANATAKH